MVGVITNAEKIHFLKEKKKEERLEIVVDVQFIYDILGLKLIRTIGNDEVHYN